MTSNIALQTTSPVPPASTDSTDIFKSITPMPAGRNLLATGSRALTGGTPNIPGAGSDATMRLAAGVGGLVPRPSPAVQIKVWKNIVQPSVAPGIRTTTTPAAVFGKSLDFDRSVGGSNVPGGAATIFNRNSRKVVVPGLPVQSRPVEASLVTNLNQALTGPRVAAFKQLNPGQQKVARALLEAVLEGMSKPAGDPNRIDPKHMGKLIDLVFKDVRSMMVVDEVSLRVQPSKTQPIVPVKPKPATAIERIAPVAEAIQRVQPESKKVVPVKPATPPVVAAETTPTPTPRTSAIVPTTGTTATPATTPNPATSAQTVVAWPFAGETPPAWFAPAIAYDPIPTSPTYQPDRDMGKKVVALVVDSREFAAQASTITVTQELAARWDVWKQA